jgi:hypothetical protein
MDTEGRHIQFGLEHRPSKPVLCPGPAVLRWTPVGANVLSLFSITDGKDSCWIVALTQAAVAFFRIVVLARSRNYGRVRFQMP